MIGLGNVGLLTLLITAIAASSNDCSDGEIIQNIFFPIVAKLGVYSNLLFDLLSGLLMGSSSCNHLRNFGGGIVPGKTMGEVWPLPQQFVQQKKYLKLTTPTNNFLFTYQGTTCAIIDRAITRYRTLIFNPPRFASYVGINEALNPADLVGTLTGIRLILIGGCESLPYLNMDESYELQVGSSTSPQEAQLKAQSVWGILRGLETFSQLIYHANSADFYVNSTYIKDFPRFPFRGFLLDTSRHYLSIQKIKEHLDAMTYNKFNVFHWHVTDDPSFPYQSQVYPNLSKMGAFNPYTLIYTPDSIESIVNYAADRGIRVIPEFDTPSHTQSWGLSAPQIRTSCPSDSTTNAIKRGALNPAIEETYTFLSKLYGEIGNLFPDKTFHLGGDEVDEDCWNNNNDVRKFKLTHPHLLTYYINRVIDITGSLNVGRDSIVWHDVFDDNGSLNKSAIINVWQTFGHDFKMQSVTKKGYKAILSACWYLNNPSFGRDWTEFYVCEPLNFIGTKQQYDLVLGGTGCMWGEHIDSTNVIPRTWPRASAVGERLWSSKSTTNINAAAPRLEEQRCRMIERGINAQPPNGPNYCPGDYLV